MKALVGTTITSQFTDGEQRLGGMNYSSLVIQASNAKSQSILGLATGFANGSEVSTKI